jgi:hypothetical protein
MGKISYEAKVSSQDLNGFFDEDEKKDTTENQASSPDPS